VFGDELDVTCSTHLLPWLATYRPSTIFMMYKLAEVGDDGIDPDLLPSWRNVATFVSDDQRQHMTIKR